MGTGMCKPGFLLMEAVGAIFFLTIIAIIVGNYWGHITHIRSVTQQKMEATVLVGQLFDQCAAGQLAWTALEGKRGPYMMTCVTKPIHITSDSYCPTSVPLFITLLVQWKNQGREYHAEYRSVCMQRGL